MTIAPFSELVRTLYQGVLELPPWQSFLSTLLTQLDVQDAIIILRHPSESDLGTMVHMNSTNQSIKKENNYTKSLYSLDPFTNITPGKAVTLDEYVPEKILLKSDFYRLALEPANIFHILGVDIKVKNGLKASLRLTRPKTARAFHAEDKKLCAMLIPHFEQSIELHARINLIETERSLYANTVDQMSIATVLLDENRQVLKTNTLASVILKEKDGIRLVEGKLQIDRNKDNTQFRQIILAALSAHTGRQAGQHLDRHSGQQSCVVEALSIERPSGKAPLGLIIRTIPNNEWAEGQSKPTIAIFIGDPAKKAKASSQVLAKLFQLTPAQARLAMLLANGASLDDAVAELAISRNTGRAHLRAIFSKTGVTQQTQLVSLLLKSVTTLGTSDD
jgi:DNA-binding CsgD family transcriptional regulator